MLARMAYTPLVLRVDGGGLGLGRADQLEPRAHAKPSTSSERVKLPWILTEPTPLLIGAVCPPRRRRDCSAAAG